MWVKNKDFDESILPKVGKKCILDAYAGNYFIFQIL